MEATRQKEHNEDTRLYEQKPPKRGPHISTASFDMRPTLLPLHPEPTSTHKDSACSPLLHEQDAERLSAATGHDRGCTQAYSTPERAHVTLRDAVGANVTRNERRQHEPHKCAVGVQTVPMAACIAPARTRLVRCKARTVCIVSSLVHLYAEVAAL